MISKCVGLLWATRAIFAYSMIEIDCSRQSKNQRGESLSKNKTKNSRRAELSQMCRRANERVSTAGATKHEPRRQVDREGFV
jgi:biotin carboxylase